MPSQPGVALSRVLLLALGPLKQGPEGQEFLQQVIQAIKVHTQKDAEVDCFHKCLGSQCDLNFLTKLQSIQKALNAILSLEK